MTTNFNVGDAVVLNNDNPTNYRGLRGVIREMHAISPKYVYVNWEKTKFGRVPGSMVYVGRIERIQEIAS